MNEHHDDALSITTMDTPVGMLTLIASDHGLRAVLWPDGPPEPALDLSVELVPAGNGDVPYLDIRTTSGKVFGPQPFLAIELKGRRFVHDNLDFSPTGDRWYYAFHHDTLPLDEVARVGIAANDRFGNTIVRQVEICG